MSQPQTPRESTQGPASSSKEIVVFIIRRPTTCADCGEDLGPGRWIRVENNKALCLACADLAHLEFLASGNTALTRRAAKYSPLRAVVVRWAHARKRYERQGILVTREALDQAEAECLADEERRARQREGAPAQRQIEDRQYEAAVAAKLRELFPGCPADEAVQIAAWTC
jgi:hypothetical protein